MKFKTIPLVLALSLFGVFFATPGLATGLYEADPLFVSSITIGFPEVPGMTVTLTNVYEYFFEGIIQDGDIITNHPSEIHAGDRYCYFTLFETDYAIGSATFNRDVHVWASGYTTDRNDITQPLRDTFDEPYSAQEILMIKSGQSFVSGETMIPTYRLPEFFVKTTTVNGEALWVIFAHAPFSGYSNDSPVVPYDVFSVSNPPHKTHISELAAKSQSSVKPIAYDELRQANAANNLFSLGLFHGVGDNADGTPNFALDRAPTRAEMITMFVRLLGKDEAALSGTWTMPFTDVAGWARPYVGYAYTNGYTNGTSATTFGSGNPATASQYITLVLRALGYSSDSDFAWNAAWELSDELGFTNGEYNAKSAFTRGNVALVSFDALSAVDKATGKALFELLIENGAITRETAKSVGLIG